MIRQGTWWIKSKSDPRWYASGRGEVGMFSVDGREYQEVVDSLINRYGDPPVDLRIGYMKD